MIEICRYQLIVTCDYQDCLCYLDSSGEDCSSNELYYKRKLLGGCRGRFIL